MEAADGHASPGVEDQSSLQIRIKCPKAGKHEERSVSQEMVPPDSADLERASDHEGARVDQSAPSLDDELDNDEDDANVDAENHHLGGNNEPPSEAEEEVAHNEVDEDPGSSKGMQESKDVPRCPECGKNFRSHKSLYGHLRCHPDRKYRGANPPPDARKKLQSSASSSAARAVPPKTKWRTAKRGQKGCDDPEVIGAANILMYLLDANHPGLKTTTTEEEETEMKQVLGTYLDDKNGCGWDQNSDNMHADHCGNELLSRYKRIKKRKIKELEQVNESNTSARGRRYQCSVCSKTFSSHQALGGHRASHNKNKSNPEEATTADEINGGVNNNVKHAEELVHSNNAVAKVANAEHRCTNCNLTFPTGQALGGHKRRHFNELQNQAPSSSAYSSGSYKGGNHELLQNRAASSSAQYSSQCDKGGNHELSQNAAASSSAHSSGSEKGANHEQLGFDLNEVPELQGEEN